MSLIPRVVVRRWLETLLALFSLAVLYVNQHREAMPRALDLKDDTNPLVATVQATATAMDEAKLKFKMTLKPFSYRPTFHFAARLLGLDVTKINDLA